ncbi:hypothetical protein PsorP6_001570 [Peronosclerospora sorghi]|uniref:Uncharacterized protein n=1 Tax=Peronosclerospora sorghi TaxID=230839 RepID=A0ACC0WTQ3_9STRA|nr:hypothetical protein PsorP6_001570 [Peronosclerospora sorghi]
MLTEVAHLQFLAVWDLCSGVGTWDAHRAGKGASAVGERRGILQTTRGQYFPVHHTSNLLIALLALKLPVLLFKCSMHAVKNSQQIAIGLFHIALQARVRSLDARRGGVAQMQMLVGPRRNEALIVRPDPHRLDICDRLRIGAVLLSQCGPSLLEHQRHAEAVGLVRAVHQQHRVVSSCELHRPWMRQKQVGVEAVVVAYILGDTLMLIQLGKQHLDWCDHPDAPCVPSSSAVYVANVELHGWIQQLQIIQDCFTGGIVCIHLLESLLLSSIEAARSRMCQKVLRRLMIVLDVLDDQTPAVVVSLGARAVESERTALATSRGDTRANRLAVIGTTTIALEIHFAFISASVLGNDESLTDGVLLAIVDQLLL